ncbi:MAG: hypothetical protein A3D31_15510 [Candidatus Fluviicola riflensis]|nr:MAG: hypothetical protein CHH17_00445 [Candidatus Fluviicola riflensis]OGS78366.1 MAG: hypothetical protein A3D31_15510 [Candidatus Fluviicola riflensis]OGS85432.1 MAG: hypothetical protein A2724_12445 [Fluviicola sp. RIFCSPHIGHO2_01_FULL_43_53]OGS87474.1 MAG: hypothetical protein A3E30_08865 [Fluviicola sp. RIFCSPHIGHO2_12_FULL_43_24]
MKKTVKFIAIAFIGIGLFSTSCKKKEEQEEYNQVALDATSSEDDEMMTRDEEIFVGSPCNYDLTQLLAPCAIVTETSADFPKTITIDYGTGCTNSNGVTKKGKVIIYMSNPLNTVGAVRQISFDGFYINSTQITGTKNLENTGLNSSGNALISVDADLTFTNGNGTRTRSSDHVREWIGHSTCEPEDDEFLITGSGSVTRNNGTVRPYSIATAVHINYSCRYPVAGEIDFGTSSKRGCIINYGSGECDEFVQLTTKRRNKVFTINLATRTIE